MKPEAFMYPDQFYILNRNHEPYVTKFFKASRKAAGIEE
jgi:hypothetical protein